MSQRPQPPEGVSFYGGPFSNFQPSVIRLPHPYPPNEDVPTFAVYPTVEHRFQAMKAGSRSPHDFIQQASTPREAKQLGREVALRPDWEDIKYVVMVEALWAKFELPTFREILVSTGDRFIFEDSPTDAQWGLWNRAEDAWTGLNLLGRALMLVRHVIAAGGGHAEVVAAALSPPVE